MANAINVWERVKSMPNKILITSSDPKPTTFKLWDMLSEEDRIKLVSAMRKRGMIGWRPETEIIVESSSEIKRIMEEKPIGRQAIV